MTTKPTTTETTIAEIRVRTAEAWEHRSSGNEDRNGPLYGLGQHLDDIDFLLAELDKREAEIERFERQLRNGVAKECEDLLALADCEHSSDNPEVQCRWCDGVKAAIECIRDTPPSRQGMTVTVGASETLTDYSGDDPLDECRYPDVPIESDSWLK